MECDVVERELLGYLFGAKWDRRTHRGARMIVRKVGGFFFGFRFSWIRYDVCFVFYLYFLHILFCFT
jgi:hypothetical protein